jgi:hypothetical protein
MPNQAKIINRANAGAFLVRDHPYQKGYLSMGHVGLVNRIRFE